MNVGFLSRKSSVTETALAVLAVIGALLLFLDVFSWLQPTIDVPVAVLLGLGGLILMLPAFIFYRGNTAYARGERVFSGCIWDSDQDAWLSGSFRVRIDAHAGSRYIRPVRELSPHPTLPSEIMTSTPSELLITFHARWNEEYSASFCLCAQGREVCQLPDLYLLADSKLHQFTGVFGGTLLERLRRLGDALVPTAGRIPVAVKLMVLSPENAKQAGTAYSGSRMAFGAAGALVGAGIDHSKETGRTAMRNKLIHGEPNKKSDSLTAIATQFGWALSLDGVSLQGEQL